MDKETLFNSGMLSNMGSCGACVEQLVFGKISVPHKKNCNHSKLQLSIEMLKEERQIVQELFSNSKLNGTVRQILAHRYIRLNQTLITVDP